VAYRTDIGNRDRSAAIAAVIAIHVGLLFMLLHLSGRMDVPGADSVLRAFNLTQPPPPPPPPQQKRQPKPKQKEGGSAPPNIRSEATPVNAPKPKVVIPPVPQIAASETPRQGSASTQGSSDRPGPGTGAGGVGTGTGSGAGGNGPGGGGGDNGVAEPPHLATPVLTGRDFSSDVLQQWPRGATIFLRLRVDARGYVIGCDIIRGSGVTTIDGAMCNLAHDRLRFRPALSRSGQPVAGWFGYAQRAPR
jgi:periplasmic protein TonB